MQTWKDETKNIYTKDISTVNSNISRWRNAAQICQQDLMMIKINPFFHEPESRHTHTYLYIGTDRERETGKSIQPGWLDNENRSFFIISLSTHTHTHTHTHIYMCLGSG